MALLVPGFLLGVTRKATRRNEDPHIRFSDCGQERTELVGWHWRFLTFYLHFNAWHLRSKWVTKGDDVDPSIWPGRSHVGNEIVHGPQQGSNQILEIVRWHFLHVFADLGPRAFLSLLKDDGCLHFVRFRFLDIGRFRLRSLPGPIQAPSLVDKCFGGGEFRVRVLT